jgi:hypothetical protein
MVPGTDAPTVDIAPDAALTQDARYKLQKVEITNFWGA